MKKIFFYLFIVTFAFSCKNTPVQSDPVPEHDNFTVNSKILNETREINVWTPPNYKTSIDSLPVLYMPDGGIEGEDFPHIANTIAALVQSKRISPIILVGIKNIDRRKDLSGFSTVAKDAEYCPLSDGAKDFRGFIANELVPEITNKYRTSGRRGIIGESLAGLFVIETLLENPETFDFYIAMDPSLWWNDHYLVKNAKASLEKLPTKNITLWFAGSSAEDISLYTNSLHKLLQTNAPKTLHWKYSDEPNEQHNTIFRATKEKALIWTLNEK